MASAPNGSWHCGPLGDEIELFLGEAGPGEGHARALANWNRTINALDGSSRKPVFESSLSLSQLNSFRIILEWWNGSTQHMILSQAARDSLQEAADMRHAESKNLDCDREAAKLDESTYHNTAFLLFQLEFVYETRSAYGEDYGTFLGFLQGERERFAQFAALQRVANSFLCAVPSEGHLMTSEGNCVSVEPLRNLLQRSIGACIEACPWLRIRNGKGKHPFYLWDVIARRTVRVEELKEPPQYTCISHTWGRWVETKKSYAKVSGVPWPIPRNSKFVVDDLPDILGESFSAGYVWFDLLCIPQDMSKRALVEISRQAVIFGNATSVVAWLNDVQSWDGLRDVVRWLSLFYLHTSVAKIQDVDNIPELPDSLNGPFNTIELYSEESHNQDLDDSAYSDDPTLIPPLPWFTSLWTLQEACLRPDMALCDRNWEPLTAGPNTIVTLDCLVALNNFIDKRMYQSSVLRKAGKSIAVEFDENDEPYVPPAADDLGTILHETCMDELIWMSPSAVFTFGQLRQCTQSRAQAIMSVVGATEWFEDHVTQLHTAPSEDDLVLGLYPLSFLQEAANKLGPTFYTARPSDLQYLSGVIDLENGKWKPLVDTQAIGSILPFTSSPTFLSPPQKYAFDFYDHTAVQTWKIQGDGSVKMTQAGVLTFGVEEDVEKDDDDIIIAPLLDAEGELSLESDITDQHGQDLEAWLRTFAEPSSMPNYAVCLYQQIYYNRSIPGPQVGVLLKQLKTVENQSILVKVGLYLTRASRAWDIRTKEVDWIVL